MHTLDHQFDFVDRLRVIAYANQVRLFEELIGNVLRKCVFVIERDFERGNAIVFQPERGGTLLNPTLLNTGGSSRGVLLLRQRATPAGDRSPENPGRG